MARSCNPLRIPVTWVSMLTHGNYLCLHYDAIEKNCRCHHWILHCCREGIIVNPPRTSCDWGSSQRWTYPYSRKWCMTEVFTCSSPSNILSFIQPVRKASQSWFSGMGRLVNGSPGFGMGNFVCSFVNGCRMWWIRHCLIRRCAMCVHDDGSRARKLRVNLSCNPRMLLICGSSCGIGSQVSVADLSCHGKWRAAWVGTCWNK